MREVIVALQLHLCVSKKGETKTMGVSQVVVHQNRIEKACDNRQHHSTVHLICKEPVKTSYMFILSIRVWYNNNMYFFSSFYLLQIKFYTLRRL